MLLAGFGGEGYFRFWFELSGRDSSGNGNSLRYSGDVIGSRVQR